MANSNEMRATLANDVKLPLEIKEAIAGLLRPYKMDIDDLLTPKVTKPTQMDGRQWLSVKEACLISSLSRFSIARYAKSGDLEVLKLSPAKSGKVLVSAAGLERFLSSKKQGRC